MEKEMQLIMHIIQYHLPFLHKSFQSRTAIKTVFRIITPQYQLPIGQSQYRCGAAEGEEVNIFIPCV
jgi:hypothetical protein